MSQANAAARKRRGVPSSPSMPVATNNINNAQNVQTQPNMMTIQQIIQYLDTRLVNLEKNASSPPPPVDTDPSIHIKLAIEYNDRFNIIAKEINDINTLFTEKDAKISQLESTISILQTMLFQLEEKVNKMEEGEKNE